MVWVLLCWPHLTNTRLITLRTQSHGVALLANPPKPTKKVNFCLLSDHINKDSSIYCKSETSTEDMWIKVTTRTPIHKVTVNSIPRPQNTNRFALLDNQDNNEDSALTTSSPHHQLALLVLDHDTGKTLEHRQLRKHPDYKETWDQSYANKLGQLCQGIGIKPSDPHLKPSAHTISPPSSCANTITTCTLPK